MAFAAIDDHIFDNPLLGWLAAARLAPDPSSVYERPPRASLAPERPSLDQTRKLEMVGLMTSGVAHDFNNHLQTIMSSLVVMQRRIHRGDVAEISRLVGFALESTAAAAALSQRLLEFSRADKPNPRPQSVNALIAGMRDLLRWTLGPGIDLELALSDVVAQVSCDRCQLENVVLNLAINARDAMAYGGKLRIETDGADLVVACAGLPLGPYLRIGVADDGGGMAPEIMERAFEPFFTTKPFGEGTGLGLAMTKAFANEVGGHVDIESVLGVGTIVNLYLPRN